MSTSSRPERWLVAAAFAPELDRLRARLRRLPPAQRARFVVGTVGVGLVEAAIGASRLLASHRPDAVVLLGTAGVYPGHANALPLGSAVIASSAVLLPHFGHEHDAFLPALMPSRVRCAPALCRALARATALPVADVACPLAITRSATAARAAARGSGCALENLETFAVARAASSARIPFAAVLGIANRVGPAGHREWQRHAAAAAATACDAFLLATCAAAG